MKAESAFFTYLYPFLHVKWFLNTFSVTKIRLNSIALKFYFFETKCFILPNKNLTNEKDFDIQGILYHIFESYIVN